MQESARLPGLRLATAVIAIYGVVWISLEGDLAQTVLMGIGLSLVTAGHAGQRLVLGRKLGSFQRFSLAAGSGLALGLSCALLTLVLMAMKTGLHGHGPEFSADEIEWVVRRIPIWGAAGLLAGLGLGLIWEGSA